MKIGYRKTTIVWVYLSMSYAGLLFKHYSGEHWLKYTAMILGSYFAANLVEHIGGKK